MFGCPGVFRWWRCQIMGEFLEQFWVICLLMCVMVIISYRILVCMDILKASYSGAFSILSSCRVCKNTFYGVFMFG